MVKKVLKFGGTSVGTSERIQHVAKIIKKEQSFGNKIIVVVSAMAGKTNELINLSKEISEEFNKREMDVLLSSGEQVTSALLSGALIEEDVKFISSANKIISNEDCIHLATSDSALYYLLRKPSCTRFYFSWSIGSKKNQALTVKELKLSQTNFVILNGVSDNWSLSFDHKHPIIFEFINNNFKKRILLNNRILLYR